jgi:3-isopropylmalate/(R)-2-methylmalate dehydratase small subunit
MQSVFTGPVYVVRDNIDTDQIISAQYLNLVPTIPDEYEKLGSFALAGLPDSLYPVRFVKPGQVDSDYPIVVGGRNFGCGSSREHAPWAWLQFGFRAVISTSFADIFKQNSLKNGLLPIVVPREIHSRLLAAPNAVVTVDLETQTLTLTDGSAVEFPIDAFSRHCLLEGVDELGYILQQAPAIDAYEARRS